MSKSGGAARGLAAEQGKRGPARRPEDSLLLNKFPYKKQEHFEYTTARAFGDQAPVEK